MKFVSCCNKVHLWIHIETANLADSTNELLPTHVNELVDVQVNLTEVAEDLNQCSEEPKANSAQEGNPRCILMAIIFKYMQYML